LESCLLSAVPKILKPCGWKEMEIFFVFVSKKVKRGSWGVGQFLPGLWLVTWAAHGPGQLA
jgi:hypothetical protein